MINRRHFIAALAAAAATAPVFSSDSPNVDVYLDPN
jgi:hypothetical protein